MQRTLNITLRSNGGFLKAAVTAQVPEIIAGFLGKAGLEGTCLIKISKGFLGKAKPLTLRIKKTDSQEVTLHICGTTGKDRYTGILSLDNTRVSQFIEKLQGVCEGSLYTFDPAHLPREITRNERLDPADKVKVQWRDAAPHELGNLLKIMEKYRPLPGMSTRVLARIEQLSAQKEQRERAAALVSVLTRKIEIETVDLENLKTQLREKESALKLLMDEKRRNEAIVSDPVLIHAAQDYENLLRLTESPR